MSDKDKKDRTGEGSGTLNDDAGDSGRTEGTGGMSAFMTMAFGPGRIPSGSEASDTSQGTPPDAGAEPEVEVDEGGVEEEPMPPGMGLGRQDPGNLNQTALFDSSPGEPEPVEKTGYEILGGEPLGEDSAEVDVADADAPTDSATDTDVSTDTSVDTGPEMDTEEEVDALNAGINITVEGIRINPLNREEKVLLENWDDLEATQINAMVLERLRQAQIIREEIETGVHADNVDWGAFEWLSAVIGRVDRSGGAAYDRMVAVETALEGIVIQAEVLGREAEARAEEEKAAVDELGRVAREGLGAEDATRTQVLGAVPDAEAEEAGVPTGQMVSGDVPSKFKKTAVLRAPADTGDVEEEGRFSVTTGGGEVDPNGKTEYQTPVPTGDTGSRKLRTSDIARKVMEGRASPEFVLYGDIFYEMELIAKVIEKDKGKFEESVMRLDTLLGTFGTAPTVTVEMLRDDVDAAIERYMEELFVVDEEAIVYTPEWRRLEKLKNFRELVFEGEEDAVERTLEYMFWVKEQRKQSDELMEAFEILGISPSEHCRTAMDVACGTFIEQKDRESLAGDEETKRVEKLQEFLLAEQGEEVEADLRYMMLTGHVNKRSREKLSQFQKELAEYKVSAEEFEAKMGQMVELLADIQVLMQDVNANSEAILPRIAEGLKALEPEDAQKRDSFLRMIKDAQERKGAVGKVLSDSAEVGAALIERGGVKPTRTSPDVQRKLDEQRGQARREVAMPFWAKIGIGASVLANVVLGGWTLYKAGQEDGQERVLEELRNMQKGAIVDVGGARIAGDAQPVLPPGIVEGGMDTDTDTEVPMGVGPEPKPKPEGMPKPEETDVESDTGMDFTKEKPGEGTEPAQDGVDADGAEGAEVGTEQPKPAGEAGAAEANKLTVHNYPRTAEGLSKALDAWCADAKYLAVDNEMLRAAYGSIEDRLVKRAKERGKRIPLPGDKSWPGHMVRMKFGNPVYAIAVLSDVWRLEGKWITPEEEYAVGMRLAIELARRSAEKETFSEMISRTNKRIKRLNRENGTDVPLVPSLKKNSLLGGTEYYPNENGKYERYLPIESRWLVLTQYNRVMSEITEKLEEEKVAVAHAAALERSGKTKELKGEAYAELEAELEAVAEYFTAQKFKELAIEEITEAVGSAGAAEEISRIDEVMGKVEKDGFYGKLGEDLKKLGLEGEKHESLMKELEELEQAGEFKRKAKGAITKAVNGVYEIVKKVEKEGFYKKLVKDLKKLGLEEEKYEALVEVVTVLKQDAEGAMGEGYVQRAMELLKEKTAGAFENEKKAEKFLKRTEKAMIKSMKERQREFMGNVHRVLGALDDSVFKRFKAAVQDALSSVRTKALKLKFEMYTKDLEGRGGLEEGAKTKLRLKEVMERRKGKKSRNGKKKKSGKNGSGKKGPKQVSQFSYRGGIGVDAESAGQRLEKREAYLAMFRVREGVDKKSSPFKQMASKVAKRFKRVPMVPART